MINAILILCAYLLGAIPSALWIGKIFYKTDIREHGSGNLGTTNTFRTIGKKAGAVVLTMDILKGTAAVLLASIPAFDGNTVHPLLLGVVAVFGHMFPIFASFRGGKAVATSAGVLLAYALPLFFTLIVVFFITLKISKMVSLSSIVVCFAAMIYTTTYWILTGDFSLFLLCLVLSIFIINRHRENIKRIKNGTEPKVKWL